MKKKKSKICTNRSRRTVAASTTFKDIVSYLLILTSRGIKKTSAFCPISHVSYVCPLSRHIVVMVRVNVSWVMYLMIKRRRLCRVGHKERERKRDEVADKESLLSHETTNMYNA